MPSPPLATTTAIATAAHRRIALQMLQERGRGAVLLGVTRVDATLEWLLQAMLLPSPICGDSLQQLTLYQPPVLMGCCGLLRQEPTW